MDSKSVVLVWFIMRLYNILQIMSHPQGHRHLTRKGSPFNLCLMFKDSANMWLKSKADKQDTQYPQYRQVVGWIRSHQHLVVPMGKSPLLVKRILCHSKMDMALIKCLHMAGCLLNKILAVSLLPFSVRIHQDLWLQEGLILWNQVLHIKWRLYFLSLAPNSGQHLISPYSMTAASSNKIKGNYCQLKLMIVR